MPSTTRMTPDTIDWIEHCCVVIPAYNEETRIAATVRGALGYCPHVMVVDDGSTDRTGLNAGGAGAYVIRCEVNRGKGAALEAGFVHARQMKYRAVITMDADGQHDPADIPKFIETHLKTGIPVLIGNRMSDPKDMFWFRRWANRVLSMLLSNEMRWYVPDTQCGFRLYRADLIPYISSREQRYAAESEVLLQIAHRGIRVGSVRIHTLSGRGRSHIKPIRDTVRFFCMLRRFRKTLRGEHE